MATNFIYNSLLFYKIITSIMQKQRTTRYQENSQLSANVQYQLMSLLMQKNPKELVLKELEIMEQSKALSNRINTYYQSTKGELMETKASINDFPSSNQDMDHLHRQRPLKRKSVANKSQLRRINGVQEALNEIGTKCSQKTYEQIKLLWDDYSKTASNQLEIQMKQRNHRKSQLQKTKIEEKLLITEASNTQLNKRIQELEKKISSLQLQNRELKHLVEQSQAARDKFSRAEELFQDRLKLLNEQSLQLRQIQKSVEGKLFDPEQYGTDPCDKCCTLLGRMRNSIIQYKDHTQKVMGETDLIWKKHGTTAE